MGLIENSLPDQLENQLNQNLLIVGPPDTGKELFLKMSPIFKNMLYLDLNEHELVFACLKNSEFLDEIINSVQPGEWLTINRIDRIQKCLPKLINSIKYKKIFIAATAVSLNSLNFNKDDQKLFNMTYTSSLPFFKIKNSLNLYGILSYGTLPKVYNLEKSSDKIKYLKNYLDDFLNLEIISRSLVRNLVPFHLFLLLITKCIGEKINYTFIALELDIDYKTVQNYFDLLMSHNVGFFLPSYSNTIRKEQIKSSKFYLFDPGFHRAIAKNLDYPLNENCLEFSLLFKSWCISEVHKIIKLKKLNWKLSQLETKSELKIDLIIEKPDGTNQLINFLCVTKILPKYLKNLKKLGSSFQNSKLFCVVSSDLNYDDELVNVISFIQFLDSI